jgi:hypothetical protein
VSTSALGVRAGLAGGAQNHDCDTMGRDQRGIEHQPTKRDHPSAKDARENKNLEQMPVAYKIGFCSRADCFHPESDGRFPDAGVM